MWSTLKETLKSEVGCFDKCVGLLKAFFEFMN